MYVHFLNLICAQKSHTVRYLCVEQYLFMIIYTIEVCNQGNTNSVLPLTLTVSGLSSGQAGLVPTLSDTTAQRKLWPKPHSNSDYNKTVYFKGDIFDAEFWKDHQISRSLENGSQTMAVLEFLATFCCFPLPPSLLLLILKLNVKPRQTKHQPPHG